MMTTKCEEAAFQDAVERSPGQHTAQPPITVPTIASAVGCCCPSCRPCAMAVGVGAGGRRPSIQGSPPVAGCCA